MSASASSRHESSPPGRPADGTPDRILIIEDDRSLREGLAMNLRMEGFEAVSAADCETGLRLAFDGRPDLIVLDLMLPGGSGLDILEALRARGETVQVLILSARGTTPDKVEGLNTGADDYMTKPFDLPELIARIRAMLRRQHTDTQALPELVFGDIAIDRAARSVKVRGREIHLSAREFDLLALLAASPGQVFTRETILERVWGWDYEGTARTVDNFVAGLRKKLGGGRRRAAYILTVPRVGYRFEAEA
ncbi:MAG: response regulator transcription factor [Lentisphaerae bacterium]|nr:response regulator transcription factor [Lentisphaerota bacterium]